MSLFQKFAEQQQRKPQRLSPGSECLHGSGATEQVALVEFGQSASIKADRVEPAPGTGRFFAKEMTLVAPHVDAA
jgi:hypothetical protein